MLIAAATTTTGGHSGGGSFFLLFILLGLGAMWLGSLAQAATQKLAESAHKLAEQMYAQEQAQQGQPGAGASAGAGQSAGGQKQQQDDGNVVDAEYEEVKDKK